MPALKANVFIKALPAPFKLLAFAIFVAPPSNIKSIGFARPLRVPLKAALRFPFHPLALNALKLFWTRLPKFRGLRRLPKFPKLDLALVSKFVRLGFEFLNVSGRSLGSILFNDLPVWRFAFPGISISASSGMPLDRLEGTVVCMELRGLLAASTTLSVSSGTSELVRALEACTLFIASSWAFKSLLDVSTSASMSAWSYMFSKMSS